MVEAGDLIAGCGCLSGFLARQHHSAMDYGGGEVSRCCRPGCVASVNQRNFSAGPMNSVTAERTQTRNQPAPYGARKR